MKPSLLLSAPLSSAPMADLAAVFPVDAVAEAQATHLALLATGMDSFAAIEPAAQGDPVVAAHLWLDALRLVEIPAGTFKMGSRTVERNPWLDALRQVGIQAEAFLMGSRTIERNPDGAEGPAHTVVIVRPFNMGAVQITQGAWEAVMGSNASSFRGPDLPMENVTWEQICRQEGFLDRLNTLTEGAKPDGMEFRLPSEAEWEHACRAGTDTAYSFGDDWASLAEYGWFHDNADGKTHPVGQKKPNPWGLYDMHGNVLEWCADAWHDSYKGAPKDGSVWGEGGNQACRVLRGGNWGSTAGAARSGCRNKQDTYIDSHLIGFRVVLAAHAKFSKGNA